MLVSGVRLDLVLPTCGHFGSNTTDLFAIPEPLLVALQAPAKPFNVFRSSSCLKPCSSEAWMLADAFGWLRSVVCSGGDFAGGRDGAGPSPHQSRGVR